MSDKIPADIANITSLRELREKVDGLAQTDQVSALTALGHIYRRAPEHVEMLLGVLLSGLILSLVTMLFIATLLWGLFMLVAAHIAFLPASPSTFVYGWLAIEFVWCLLILRGNDQARKILDFSSVLPDKRENVPVLFNLSLFPGQLLAWTLALLTHVISISAALLIMLKAVEFGYIWLQKNFTNLLPGLRQSLSPASAAEIALLVCLLFVTLLINKKKSWFLLGSLVFVGSWLLLNRFVALSPTYTSNNAFSTQFGGSTYPRLFFEYGVVVLAALFPLKISNLLARIFLKLFLAWQSRIIWLIRGWRLRSSLSKAFRAHRIRNEKHVENDGRHAYCRTDLARFISQQSGPVTYWQCPVCKNDTNPYTHIKKVQGVLDKTISFDNIQAERALQINLLNWINGNLIMPLPDLDEVIIGMLDDDYEVEAFIVKYHEPQSNGRPPKSLKDIDCVLLPQANVGETARRQIRKHFRS